MTNASAWSASSSTVEPHVRVSVLMLACNRPEFMGRAIESILSQRFRGWELLVVNNGSNKTVEGIMAEWVARDPRIHFFHRRTPSNIAGAYNFGVEQARGDYIAILDDDDYWVAPNKLEKQVAFLDAYPEYVGCGGGMIVIDQAGLELMRYLKWEDNTKIRQWALVANPMAHSTTMFRRQIHGILTRYDDTLAGLPDWDMWLQLGKKGKLYNFQETFTCYTLWDGGVTYQRQRSNAHSALNIVWRHRKSYQNVLSALTMVLLQLLYAYLPPYLYRRSFSLLSRLKKLMFASRRTPGSGTSSRSLHP